MEDKFQKKYFSAKKHSFFGNLRVHYEPLLGWECAYGFQDLKKR